MLYFGMHYPPPTLLLQISHKYTNILLYKKFSDFEEMWAYFITGKNYVQWVVSDKRDKVLYEFYEK
jgi:hypothetical protein